MGLGRGSLVRSRSIEVFVCCWPVMKSPKVDAVSLRSLWVVLEKLRRDLWSCTQKSAYVE